VLSTIKGKKKKLQRVKEVSRPLFNCMLKNTAESKIVLATIGNDNTSCVTATLL